MAAAPSGAQNSAYRFAHVNTLNAPLFTGSAFCRPFTFHDSEQKDQKDKKVRKY